MRLTVSFLHRPDTQFDLDDGISVSDLLQQIGETLRLGPDTRYFGLSRESKREKREIWLRPEERLKRGWKVLFRLRFYPLRPSGLANSVTRTQVYFQLKRDVKSGRLPCPLDLKILLFALILQVESGDFHPSSLSQSREWQNLPFLSTGKNNTGSLTKYGIPDPVDFQRNIFETYKTQVRGMTAEEAEEKFLQLSQDLSLYGFSLHLALNERNVNVVFGVCAYGILIYRHRLQIDKISWRNIAKMYQRGPQVTMKLMDQTKLRFFLTDALESYRLWEICVEFHTFYRVNYFFQSDRRSFSNLLQSNTSSQSSISSLNSSNYHNETHSTSRNEVHFSTEASSIRYEGQNPPFTQERPDSPTLTFPENIDSSRKSTRRSPRGRKGRSSTSSSSASESESHSRTQSSRKAGASPVGGHGTTLRSPSMLKNENPPLSKASSEMQFDKSESSREQDDYVVTPQDYTDPITTKNALRIRQGKFTFHQNGARDAATSHSHDDFEDDDNLSEAILEATGLSPNLFVEKLLDF